MIIDACPRFLQGFFYPIQQFLSKPQYAHFTLMVLAFIANLRNAKLLHMASVIRGGKHRTSLGSFLQNDDWDPAVMLENRVRWILNRMKPQAGEVLELLIDDTRIAKRGKRMACLQKIWDHKQQRYVHGHVVVMGAIRFRGVMLPWQVVLWKPKSWAGKWYRKTTEIAMDMIQTLPVPKGLRVRVLFDAFYLCPMVVKACEHRGFTWFSVASRNRTFTRDRGRKAKLGHLAPGWFKHLGRNVRMPRVRGWSKLRIAQLDGHLSRIGCVRLVVSKRPYDHWKNLVVFATNEKGLNGRQIVSVYEGRWDIEVMFKELRCDLGFGDYQMLDEQAIIGHLHLCALAHLVLTHHAMEGIGVQARKANIKVEMPPMSVRLEILRAAIRRDQIKRIIKGQKYRRIREKVETYLLAA